MTTIERGTVNEPVDAVVDRLNDPAVAASLVTLLDNADLLSTLVLGLSGMLARGDTIIESITDGVNEMKSNGFVNPNDLTLPTPAEVTGLVSAMSRATPVITDVLDSSMVSSDTVDLLSLLSAAATEGAANARQHDTSVRGARATLRALKDPDVARGIGMFVEIARALGRRLDNGHNPINH